MTTANLSVGIKTDAAKRGLQELKVWMAQEMRGVVLSINEAAFSNSVKDALRNRKFEVQINREQLRASVESAVEAGFQKSYRVLIDGSFLTAQVKAAVDSGAIGAKLGAGSGAVPGVAGSATELKVLIQQILTPAVDELAKAAAVMAANAKAGGPAAKSRQTAASSFSTQDPETGERLSYRKSLEAPDAVLAAIKTRNTQKQIAEAEAANAAELQKISNETFRARRAARRYDEAQSRDELSDLQRSSNETFRARRAARRFDENQAQTELTALQRSSNETFRARQAARRFEESRAREELGDLQRSSNETFRARQAARRFEAEQLRREMSAVFERARFQAAGQYNPVGARIAGAQALSGQFGDDSARGFLGKSAFLVDEAGNLANYTRAVKAAKEETKSKTAATHLYRDTLNDAHSAARGLAGSLGALWVTWGSTVPIIAAAALGGTLRSVFVTGKDLEYQLKNVQVLSNGTAVSIKDFGNTIRGSMVGPVEAAQALRGLAQNGLDAREAMMALPSILALATAGEMSLSDAALGATGVMAAFNLQVTDLGRVGDVFATAAASSNTSVAAMVESMKQASTVSDQYKVSLDETAAALATLAKRNITGSAAGTAFRNMMVELASPSEKARKAMAQMGLQLYDSNNQLKSFSEVMSQLTGVVTNLNEKGRLTFLGEIFDERGAKAANSLLSDAKTYGAILDEIKTKSDGFSRSFVAALGETTQGKLKGLMAEFQLVTSSVFTESSDTIKNFVDQIRVYVNSADFRSLVKGLTDLVLDFTRFVAQNTETIIATVAAWKTFGLVMGGLPALIKFVEVGFVGLRAASLGAVGAMTGGLGLVAALAVEFLVLRTNTNAAEEAEKARLNTLRLANEDAERRLVSLRAENNLLAEETRLLIAGTDAIKAKNDAQRNLAQGSITKNVVEGTSREQSAQAELLRIRSDFAAAEREFGAAGARERIETLNAEMQAGRRMKEEGLRAQLLLEQTSAEESLKTQQSSYQKAIKSLVDYNERAKQVNESGKYKLPLANIEAYRRAPTARIENYAKDLTESMNKTLGGFEKPDPAAASQARRDELSEIRQIIDGIRQKEAAEKQYIKFRRELNEAVYSADKFGPYLAAKLVEQETQAESYRLLKLESDALATLNAQKARPNLKESDKTDLDREIQARTEAVAAIRREIEQRKQLSAIKARNSLDSDETAFGNALRGLRAGDDADIDKQRQKFSTKVERGGDVAENAARLQVESRYRSEIQKQQNAVLVAETARFAIAEEVNKASGKELDAMLELETAASSRLALEEARLAILQAQATAAGATSGSLARKQFEDSQTAEYGWNKFWKDYTEQATSSAQVVESVMKSTTDGLGQAFGNFVTGAKSGFRSLARDVAAQAAQMMANKAIRMLLEMGMSAIGSFGSSGSGYSWSTTDQLSPEQFSLLKSANGNVMTQYGPARLDAFRDGGITRQPMLSMIGEGTKPEAYVPLPDGRTIPVTVSGGGGGVSNSIKVDIKVVVQGGKSDVAADGEGQKAAELAGMLEGAVRSILVKETRPGGYLYENK